jgi:hypothetical protein
MRPVLALPALFVAFAFVPACSIDSRFMREASAPHQIERSPERAVIVFIRPSGFAAIAKFPVFDERGRFHGESLSDSYFVTTIEPGRHVFVAWGENTAALDATVDAGRIYTIEVSPRMAFWSGARVQLLAVKRGDHEKVSRWLTETDRFIPDVVAGQAHYNAQPDVIGVHLERGREILGEYSAEQYAERTLTPDDGV